MDYVSNSIDPNDDFIFLSAARKLPLDTLLLPNNHHYDCTSVSLISRPEAIVALDTSLHQLPVIGPVMILSLFAPNMRPRNYLLTLYCIKNASSHQNFASSHFLKRFLTPKQQRIVLQTLPHTKIFNPF